jgi:hypothetical protein
VPTHNRPPKPDQDDYRHLDPSTYDGEFFQEEGLPWKFTINLATDDDMVIDDEEHDEVEAEDIVDDVVEEVQNAQDLTLLEQFHVGLDKDEPMIPPLNFLPDYWWGGDSDDEASGPSVVPGDLKTGF